jgi:hypothetical protein
MFAMSREMSESFVEEKVTDLLAQHKQQMLKEMEGMFLKITATSQSKLSSQIASSSLTTVKFRRKSNEEQFKVNADVLSKLEDAEGSLSVENMEETRQSIISGTLCYCTIYQLFFLFLSQNCRRLAYSLFHVTHVECVLFYNGQLSVYCPVCYDCAGFVCRTLKVIM